MTVASKTACPMFTRNRLHRCRDLSANRNQALHDVPGLHQQRGQPRNWHTMRPSAAGRLGLKDCGLAAAVFPLGRDGSDTRRFSDRCGNLGRSVRLDAPKQKQRHRERLRFRQGYELTSLVPQPIDRSFYPGSLMIAS